MGRALHSRSNPIWMMQCEGADCRATAAKESAKRTCFFGTGDDPLEEMKSFFREMADAGNQQRRHAVFRNLLRRRQR
jgi:hypothetical protein